MYCCYKVALVNFQKVPFSIALIKIHIIWDALAKKLFRLSQKRLSDTIFKYWKSTEFRLSPRFYKVTTRHHIFATPLYWAMFMKHENLLLYRGLSLGKISSLGPFLQPKIAKIQIFQAHSSDSQYTNQNFKSLSIFHIKPYIFWAFCDLLGPIVLKSHGKRHFVEFD